MKTSKYLVLILALGLLFSCGGKYKTKKETDKNGYVYQYVTNDPMQSRIYTLKNGLTVYLTVNKNEPRVQTYIAVKAGSTYDPSETTGLAHYLEHMMFKGSTSMATTNWPKEEIVIKEISDLFEKHKQTTDPKEKRNIYVKIDSLSGLAAQYAVANEYDKMVSSIGAKGTNAYTSEERTVYMNDIPSNEIEKWLYLEKERFSSLVLRLFHTELETVYEEFNMSQDNDDNKAMDAMMSGLFLKHPYGTQTTIGKAEHLKNPSMVNIMKYWHTYYVPNNMAICLSGDIDPDSTIKMIDKYFGVLKPNDSIPKFIPPVEDPIQKPVIKEVKGPDAEYVALGFRLKGIKTDDRKYLTILDHLLSNGKAGLIDLDLVQKQKVLGAGSFSDFLKDYSYQEIYGNNRNGQTLEQVKDLLLGEIEKVKKGEFDDWMLTAVVNDLKLNNIKSQESNRRAHIFVEAFTENMAWVDYVKFLDDLSKVTKKDLVKFVNENYKDNYVVVYKRHGVDKNVVKVEKPPITPVSLNREGQSEFYKKFNEIKSPALQPVFVDFKKEISTSKTASGLEFNYIKNQTNELFYLYYIIDMGKSNNIKLPLAVNYLPYLGTDKYSPEQLQQELFKLGLTMGVSTSDERSYIYISGLNESFEKGVELLEHILSNVKPDNKSYDDYVDGILKERKDNKLDKRQILWGGLFNYGKYGKNSSFTNIIPANDLKKIKPAELTDILKEICKYKHRIFLYGIMKPEDATKVIDTYHKVNGVLLDYLPPVKYAELPTDQNKVYFVNYDMVQASIIMLAKDEKMNRDIFPYARVFGEYFGSGLSSIVFQEIREAKGLAYSAFAAYSIPAKPDESHYVYAFVGTQADKLKNATDAMLNLMNNMPMAGRQFQSAKEAIRKQIESERITKTNIFWTYQSNLDKNIDYDNRKDIYEKAKTISLNDFSAFFNKHISGNKYTFLVIGNKANIDMKVLESIGTVQELTLEDIFNY
jgi:predicted Zn-dependent peptidase